MTNIVVLIKQVPDTWSERKLSEGDWTLDREAADAVLDEINERAVEEALLIKEKDAYAAPGEGEQFRTRGGEADATLGAGEERHAEFVFETADLPRHRRLADRQELGGPAQVAKFVQRHQQLQVPELDVGTEGAVDMGHGGEST